MSWRIPNLLQTMAHIEGVGQNSEQLMTRISISFAFSLVLRRTSSTHPVSTTSVSKRAISVDFFPSISPGGQ